MFLLRVSFDILILTILTVKEIDDTKLRLSAGHWLGYAVRCVSLLPTSSTLLFFQAQEQALNGIFQVIWSSDLGASDYTTA